MFIVWFAHECFYSKQVMAVANEKREMSGDLWTKDVAMAYGRVLQTMIGKGH
jgi:hypothetical protein